MYLLTEIKELHLCKSLSASLLIFAANFWYHPFKTESAGPTILSGKFQDKTSWLLEDYLHTNKPFLDNHKQTWDLPKKFKVPCSFVMWYHNPDSNNCTWWSCMEWCLSATQPPDECIHLYTSVRQIAKDVNMMMQIVSILTVIHVTGLHLCLYLHFFSKAIIST